jgi:hypothetical protein
VAAWFETAQERLLTMRGETECRALILDLILRSGVFAASRRMKATEFEGVFYLPGRGGTASSRSAAWTLAMVALQ